MGHGRTRLPSVVLRGAFWFTGLIVAAAIAPPVTAAEGSLWHDLRRAVGVPVAVGLIALGLFAASLVAAAAYGWLRVPGRKALDRVAYVMSMLAYWLRQLGDRSDDGRRTLERAGNPGSGGSNRRYVTVEDFYKERNPRGPEVDYGVWWRDRGSDRAHRVTWMGGTGELIAVARGHTGDEAVELLAVIPNEDEVNRRLADWGHVGRKFRGDIAGVGSATSDRLACPTPASGSLVETSGASADAAVASSPAAEPEACRRRLPWIGARKRASC